MTPEQLMQPRIKVKVPYPNSPYTIGQVIKCADNKFGDINFYRQYPDIFQELPWYAERAEGDMPEYVHFYEFPYENYFKVVKHFIQPAWCKVENGADYPYSTLTPCTEQEYNTYNQSNQK